MIYPWTFLSCLKENTVQLQVELYFLYIFIGLMLENNIMSYYNFYIHDVRGKKSYPFMQMGWA